LIESERIEKIRIDREMQSFAGALRLGRTSHEKD